MKNQKHTVLGASGSAGKAVIKALQAKKLPIRAITRSMQIPDIEVIPADLFNLAEADKAIEGSSHVYLCVGLPYQAKLWKVQWPQLMHNVIEACAKHGAKLIFLDNIYLYGAPPLPQPFDENTKQNPVSRKGKARKVTTDILMQAIADKKVEALIGRAADFYGTATTNSMLYPMFLENMKKGKAPFSIVPLDVKHTFGDVEDIGRALVELALAEDCYGQVWHLPVGEPITYREAAEIFNKLLNTHLKAKELPGILRKLLTLFIGPLKEVEEMRYQYVHPYLMSFDKFLARFPDFKVSPYEKGFQDMIDSL